MNPHPRADRLGLVGRTVTWAGLAGQPCTGTVLAVSRDATRGSWQLLVADGAGQLHDVDVARTPSLAVAP